MDTDRHAHKKILSIWLDCETIFGRMETKVFHHKIHFIKISWIRIPNAFVRFMAIPKRRRFKRQLKMFHRYILPCNDFPSALAILATLSMTVHQFILYTDLWDGFFFFRCVYSSFTNNYFSVKRNGSTSQKRKKSFFFLFVLQLLLMN